MALKFHIVNGAWRIVGENLKVRNNLRCLGTH